MEEDIGDVLRLGNVVRQLLTGGELVGYECRGATMGDLKEVDDVW